MLIVLTFMVTGPIKCWVPWESVTSTLKLAGPEAVGVPTMEFPLIDRPAGNAPLSRIHVNGPIPNPGLRRSFRLKEYGVPSVASLRVVLVSPTTPILAPAGYSVKKARESRVVPFASVATNV
jgi:hypothetical protein